VIQEIPTEVRPSSVSKQSRGYSKILLLDGYSSRSLACVRSWGRRGIPFAVGGETRWDMSLHSTYGKETFVYTSPKKSLPRFIEDVNRFAEKFKTDCIFPTSEAAIMACSRFRNELRSAPIVPTDSEIDLLFSKANTMRLAESVGIAVPKTIRISPGASLPEEVFKLSFPLVIKSETSELLSEGKAVTSGKTAYVYTRERLESECSSRLKTGNAILVQEFIDGYGFGVSGLFVKGHPVALLAHRRIRESDPCGGPSAVAETVEIDPELLQATTAMMRQTGFTGPAMIEFKVDRRTAKPVFMEINCRFWGTILLAPAAGLDLPYLYWKLLSGQEIAPEETHYRIGIRGRYLVGDTKCLLLRLRGKPKDWPGEFPGRWSAMIEYVGSFFDRRTRNLLFTPRDPMPFFARLVQDFA
jgi:predicted ATP-grasp superfamily ATP-dependent carboligase